MLFFFGHSIPLSFFSVQLNLLHMRSMNITCPWSRTHLQIQRNTRTLIYLIRRQSLVYTKRHDVKSIRCYDSRIHISIVDQVAYNLKMNTTQFTRPCFRAQHYTLNIAMQVKYTDPILLKTTPCIKRTSNPR